MAPLVGRAHRGATLSEVALGTFIFAVFSLGVLALLIRCNQLSHQDKSLSQVNTLSEGLMEELVMLARSEDGFQKLASQSLRPANDPDYVYAVDVSSAMSGLKKVTLLLYYHDSQGSPAAIDTARPNLGLAVCLGTALEQP
ncbi:hypothetical protein JST97_36605 [bacterium]|nr:hypothetical protein [bacterium]